MFSNKLYTPLRYPGGKARFAPMIARIMESNKLFGGHYFEPFAGGAGVALILLFDGHAEHIHINDADPAIATFWKVAVNQTNDLINLIANEPITIDSWHHWRSVMIGSQESTEIEKGFATLFLNRTNRSGILKGGVIGGKNQEGKYKLDARFMRDKLCERVSKIGKFSKNIHVYNEDAHDLLKRRNDFLDRRSLIYLDPPYYIKGAGLYRNYYKHEDHLAIAKLLKNKSFTIPWIVSYDNALEIQEMYSYAQSLNYNLNYSAQRFYTGSEIMFFSKRINLPEEYLVKIAA